MKPPIRGVEIRQALCTVLPGQASRGYDDRSPCGSRSRRRGATIVQTALVLNVCLMFLLGLFDFSRVIMMRQLVTNAAREGCRYAVVNTSTATTAQVQAYVTNYLCGQQINSLVINVYEANPTTGANIGTWTNAGLSNSIGCVADHRNDQHHDPHVQPVAQQLAGARRRASWPAKAN